MKGIIISEDTFSDERIKLIESMPNGDETLIIFFRLLSLACKSNAGGFLLLNREIPYNDEMLAAIFGRSLQSVKFALTTLKQFGMIRESEEGGFQVENFLEWISDEDKAREQARIRMQKHRETKKELPAPEEDPKKGTRKKRTYSEDSVEMGLAKHFYKRLKENFPEHPEPNWNTWANELRLLMQRYKKEPEKVKNLIDWVQSNEFWCKNVMSPSKLDKQYLRLQKEAQEEYNAGKYKVNNRQAQTNEIFDNLLGGES